MGASNIEWTEASWNPIAGCTRVSPGCQHCYAERMSARIAAMAVADEQTGKDPGRKANYKLVVAGEQAVGFKPEWNGEVAILTNVIMDPFRWRAGKLIFVCSMSDLHHPGIPDFIRHQMYAVMALCRHHTFQVLTKRPEAMADFWEDEENRGQIQNWIEEFAFKLTDPHERKSHDLRAAAPVLTDQAELPDNIWMGTSVENQHYAGLRIPQLLRCKAAVRFLSVEPMLSAVSVAGRGWLLDSDVDPNAMGGEHQIHWVICGGESGPEPRQMLLDWPRKLMGECVDAGVPFFMKQICDGFGKKIGYDRWPMDLRRREWPLALAPQDANKEMGPAVE